MNAEILNLTHLPQIAKDSGLFECQSSWESKKSALYMARKIEFVGASLYRLGHFATLAEQNYRQAYEIRKEIQGPEHPDTLTTRHSLALVLYIKGEHAEGKAMSQQVLQARERVLGPDHPNTLTTRHNLAFVINRQGKHAEAEAMYRQILEVQQRVLGLEDEYTLTTRHNLAEAINYQGKHTLRPKQCVDRSWRLVNECWVLSIHILLI
jgi:tetratricopeptide (TPR) repeat protein